MMRSVYKQSSKTEFLGYRLGDLVKVWNSYSADDPDLMGVIVGFDENEDLLNFIVLLESGITENFAKWSMSFVARSQVSQVQHFMKVGSLVTFKSPGFTDSIFLRDYLTWTELHGKVIDGEICIVLAIEDRGHVSTSSDVKILSTHGYVGWTLSHYFKVIADAIG